MTDSKGTSGILSNVGRIEAGYPGLIDADLWDELSCWLKRAPLFAHKGASRRFKPPTWDPAEQYSYTWLGEYW